MKLVLAILFTVALTGGCRTIDAEKHADGSWEAHYRSYGVFSELGHLNINIDTNGIVHLELDDFSTDMSTNHVAIVTASGDFAGEIAEHVIEGLSK